MGGRRSSHRSGCASFLVLVDRDLLYPVLLLLLVADQGSEASAIGLSKKLSLRAPVVFNHHRNRSTLIQPPEWMTEPLFHSPRVFALDYADMKANLKIYIYPYPGTNVSMQFGRNSSKGDARLPSGSYASEPYLYRNLHESELRTNDPGSAHFFALPFSVLNLRMSVGPTSVSKWVREFMQNTVTQNWLYWNRTGGADHFYFTCHDIGVHAAEKTPHLSGSAIQIICPASRWKKNYVPTKDFSFPQIWPHYDSKPGGLSAAERKKTKMLAFWSGSQNSRVRKALWETWADDDEVLLGGGRVLKKKARGKDYFSNFRRAKYCLHVSGYQVHTARIGDAIYFGCVPVIISDQFDLPFNDLLNWNEFSVVVAESQLRDLKFILKSISDKTYHRLHANVQTARQFFTWNSPPQDYDLFHMIMYDLWLRRFLIRPSLDKDMISNSGISAFSL